MLTEVQQHACVSSCSSAVNVLQYDTNTQIIRKEEEEMKKYRNESRL